MKTLEEIAKEYATHKNRNNENSTDEYAVAAFIAGAQWAQSQEGVVLAIRELTEVVKETRPYKSAFRCPM